MKGLLFSKNMVQEPLRPVIRENALKMGITKAIAACATAGGLEAVGFWEKRRVKKRERK